MKFLKVFVIAIIFLALSDYANAETRPVVSVTIGNLRQLGYRFPSIVFGINMESKTNVLDYDLWIRCSPTDKISYGDVTNLYGGLDLYYKPHESERGFLFLLGTKVGKIWFHDLLDERTSFNVALGFGYKTEDKRVLVRYQRAIKDYYHQQILSLNFRRDFKNHLRLEFDFGVDRLNNKTNIINRDVYYSQVLIGYKF